MLQLQYWADLKVIYLHCMHGESFLICYILFTAHILHLAANYFCTSNYNTIARSDYNYVVKDNRPCKQPATLAHNTLN